MSSSYIFFILLCFTLPPDDKKTIKKKCTDRVLVSRYRQIPHPPPLGSNFESRISRQKKEVASYIRTITERCAVFWKALDGIHSQRHPFFLFFRRKNIEQHLSCCGDKYISSSEKSTHRGGVWYRPTGGVWYILPLTVGTEMTNRNNYTSTSTKCVRVFLGYVSRVYTNTIKASPTRLADAAQSTLQQ